MRIYIEHIKIISNIKTMFSTINTLLTIKLLNIQLIHFKQYYAFLRTYIVQ